MLLPNMISWTRDRKLLPDEWRSKLLLYCMCAAMVRVSQATTSINPVFESGKPRSKHFWTSSKQHLTNAQEPHTKHWNTIEAALTQGVVDIASLFGFGHVAQKFRRELTRTEKKNYRTTTNIWNLSLENFLQKWLICMSYLLQAWREDRL